MGHLPLQYFSSASRNCCCPTRCRTSAVRSVVRSPGWSAKTRATSASNLCSGWSGSTCPKTARRRHSASSAASPTQVQAAAAPVGNAELACSTKYSGPTSAATLAGPAATLCVRPSPAIQSVVRFPAAENRSHSPSGLSSQSKPASVARSRSRVSSRMSSGQGLPKSRSHASRTNRRVRNSPC